MEIKKKYNPDLSFLVYSENYWITEPIFKWTKKDIESAEDGYIGTKFGINCFLSKPILYGNENHQRFIF